MKIVSDSTPWGEGFLTTGRGGESGLEGLSFDKENRRFFIVKEKNPRKFFHVTLGPAPDSVPMITEPWKKSRLKSLRQKDLSGGHFHSATRQSVLADPKLEYVPIAPIQKLVSLRFQRNECSSYWTAETL